MTKGITRAKTSKTIGIDGIFTKAFKIDKHGAAKTKGLLWEKCLQIKYTLEHWRTAQLIPILEGVPLMPYIIPTICPTFPPTKK